MIFDIKNSVYGLNEFQSQFDTLLQQLQLNLRYTSIQIIVSELIRGVCILNQNESPVREIRIALKHLFLV